MAKKSPAAKKNKAAKAKPKKALAKKSAKPVAKKSAKPVKKAAARPKPVKKTVAKKVSPNKKNKVAIKMKTSAAMKNGAKQASKTNGKKPVTIKAPATKPVAVKNRIERKPAPVVPQKPVAKPAVVAVKPAEIPKKPARVKREPAPVLPPIDTSKLPKLPKGIIVKRGKGKLAPGEKRLVKTDVITHHVIEDKPLDGDKKLKPEPKGKFTLEYVIRTPVSLLYDFLTTPNGLAEWFADGVDLKNDIYTFDWDGARQSARIVGSKLDSYLRLRWLDKPEGSYFEFRMEQDELTGEVSLYVTDFGENEEDIATLRHLWNTQIQRLVKALGTY
jgi:uncharacterized protein YndB with AHSA1/START domain